MCNFPMGLFQVRNRLWQILIKICKICLKSIYLEGGHRVSFKAVWISLPYSYSWPSQREHRGVPLKLSN